MKRVLVAGANSYFGKFFIEAHKRQGYWVRWTLSRNLNNAWQERTLWGFFYSQSNRLF